MHRSAIQLLSYNLQHSYSGIQRQRLVYLWCVCSFDHRCGRQETASERSRRSPTATDKQQIYRTSLRRQLRRPRIALVQNAASECKSNCEATETTAQPRRNNDANGCNKSLTGSITTRCCSTIYQLRASLARCHPAVRPSIRPSMRVWLRASHWVRVCCATTTNDNIRRWWRRRRLTHPLGTHRSPDVEAFVPCCSVRRMPTASCNSGIQPSGRHRYVPWVSWTTSFILFSFSVQHRIDNWLRSARSVLMFVIISDSAISHFSCQISNSFFLF